MFFPSQDRIFQIEVTTQCNLKCAGCSRTVAVQAGTWKTQHIEVDVFRTAIENARPAQAIILQGVGEPTLHPQLPELIKIARDSGKFGTISFYTNGLARSIDYYDQLKANGLNMLTVSIDSLNQSIADQCRFGTDVKKLLQRFVELFYTFAPNIQVSLVLSRKNRSDAFETFRLLNEIAKTGQEPMTVLVQKMINMSDTLAAEIGLRAEDELAFQEMFEARHASYPALRIGLVGILQTPEVPVASVMGEAYNGAPALCDKAYLDRFVTIDGCLTPCCVLTDAATFAHTKLDRPLEEAFANTASIRAWFDCLETKGQPACAKCSLFSPLSHDIDPRKRSR